MSTPSSTPQQPTLAYLDEVWDVDIPGGRRRCIGGIEGSRFVTDGGAMAIIPESEYLAGIEGGWQRMADGDHWATKTSRPTIETRPLGQPDEVRPGSIVLAVRYGCCWLAAQYVYMAMRLGGTTVLISGEHSEAVIEGLAVIMPMDMDADAGETTATRSHPGPAPRCQVEGCTEPVACLGRYEDDGEPDYACDVHCGHGNEDGHCDPVERHPGADKDPT